MTEFDFEIAIQVHVDVFTSDLTDEQMHNALTQAIANARKKSSS